MAVALSSYCSMFSVLSSSTVKFRYSHRHTHTPSQRPFISIRCSRTPSNSDPNFKGQVNPNFYLLLCFWIYFPKFTFFFLFENKHEFCSLNCFNLCFFCVDVMWQWHAMKYKYNEIHNVYFFCWSFRIRWRKGPLEGMWCQLLLSLQGKIRTLW